MGLAVHRMCPLKIIGLELVIRRLPGITEEFGILVHNIQPAAITVTDPVFRRQVKIISPIGIDIRLERNIKIIAKHFVITDSVQSQSILGTYIESGRQETRVPSRGNREI